MHNQTAVIIAQMSVILHDNPGSPTKTSNQAIIII